MDQSATTTPISGVTPPTEAALQAAIGTFRRELTKLRNDAGLSKKALARRMAFDPSYVSHIESGRHRPTEDFARRADDVLHTGGRLSQLWREYDAVRHTPTASAMVPVPLPLPPDPHADLVVEREEASIRFDGENYVITIRRHLHSVGTRPVARYWIKITSAGDADAPLTWEMLNLQASCNDEPMDWDIALDQPATKQIWLQFKNGDYQFPLYPGERAWIEYTYTVPEGIYGYWFQRAIRLPTRYLAVRLSFPSELEPRVWGTETSMTSDGAPLAATPQVTHSSGGDVEWFWEIPDPQLNARYRLLWQFAGGAARSTLAGTAEMPDGERAERHGRGERTTRGTGRRLGLNRSRHAVVR